ncbi:MAG: hypothetical protein R3217_01555 [Gammaproteobacteria bacterium]|nr:hypothetical protein [Gammaproteobacteria bacterium]
MTNYIYNEDGDAVGFWEDHLIFSMQGTPVGQLNGPSVHRLTGEYVGELYEDMVVDRYFEDIERIPPTMVRRADPASNPGNRGQQSYGYPDVFEELLT